MLIDAGLRDKKEKPIRNKIKKNIKSKAKSHADISTTLNKYCHAIPYRKRENMEKIECLYDDSLDDGI